MHTPKKFKSLALAIAAMACVASAELFSQSVTTTPVGYVNVNIAAGTGTTRSISVVSFPMLDEAVVAGQGSGQITSVTANTITNSSAGWTAGQLSTAATPCLIRITSGAAVGRTFLVSTSTANTATTLTIDAEEAGLVNLTSLGIVAGDTYKIFACDTISSIFGTPGTTGVLGATSATNADNLQVLVSGAWRQYYYNTTSNAWLRIGLNTNSNNVPLRADTIVIYSRLAASPITLSLLGTVPSTARKALVRASGVTALSESWPVDLTLATSGISSMPGWVTGSSTTADIVQVFVSGAWRQYYHNGTNWLRVGLNTVSNTVALTSASGLIINKKGSTPGSVTLSQALPYSL